MRESLNSHGLNKFVPLMVGALLYLIFIPLVQSGAGEGVIQIAFLFANIIGGWFSGKLAGTDGIIGLIMFSAIVMLGYCILQLLEPDSLWIIGLFLLGFTQAFYWGGWLIGCVQYKEK